MDGHGYDHYEGSASQERKIEATHRVTDCTRVHVTRSNTSGQDIKRTTPSRGHDAMVISSSLDVMDEQLLSAM